MRYLEIKTGKSSGKPLPWWGKLLTLILPKGNPDLEKYYDDAEIWWLEIDDQGAPQREIGFDGNMNPVVLGPLGENPGFLIDSAGDWRDSKEDSQKAAEDFEKTWTSIWPKFEHLEKKEK